MKRYLITLVLVSTSFFIYGQEGIAQSMKRLDQEYQIAIKQNSSLKYVYSISLGYPCIDESVANIFAKRNNLRIVQYKCSSGVTYINFIKNTDHPEYLNYLIKIKQQEIDEHNSWKKNLGKLLNNLRTNFSFSEYSFDPSNHLTYDLYILWVKQINARGGANVPIKNSNDKIFHKITYFIGNGNEIGALKYQGNALTYENFYKNYNKFQNNFSYGINVSKIREGMGTFFLEGGEKITGRWTNDYFDINSPATMIYSNGAEKKGYWVYNNYMHSMHFNGNPGEVPSKISEWIYLSDNKESAEYFLEKIKKSYEKSLQQIGEEISAREENKERFIREMSNSISSKVKEESFEKDYGDYIRYKISFDNGNSGFLDYYKSRNEWCTYISFLIIDFDDKCFKDKNKALCELYWDLAN